MRRERLLLEDILSAADAIAEFIRNHDRESFESDRMLRSAVTHQLTVVGEAVARLSPEFRERHPGLPWSDIRGLRNIVVHNYFGIDWAEVWGTASLDLPLLRNEIAAILRSDFPGEREG